MTTFYGPKEIKSLARRYRQDIEWAEQALRIGQWRAQQTHGDSVTRGHVYNYARDEIASELRTYSARRRAALGIRTVSEDAAAHVGTDPRAQLEARMDCLRLAEGLDHKDLEALVKVHCLGYETTELGLDVTVPRDRIRRLRAQAEQVIKHGATPVNKAPKKAATRPLRGAKWEPRREVWRARMVVDGKQIDLGRFLTKEEASAAYWKAKDELKNAPKNR